MLLQGHHIICLLFVCESICVLYQVHACTNLMYGINLYLCQHITWVPWQQLSRVYPSYTPDHTRQFLLVDVFYCFKELND